MANKTNDLKVLYDAEQGIVPPIEAPEGMSENKQVQVEYMHTPYVDEKVKEVGYPEAEEEEEEEPEKEPEGE